MAKSKKSAAKRTKLETGCPGHSAHMCELVSKRQMKKVASLAKGAKYICHICGRAAAKPSNLCEPVEI